MVTVPRAITNAVQPHSDASFRLGLAPRNMHSSLHFPLPLGLVVQRRVRTLWLIPRYFGQNFCFATLFRSHLMMASSSVLGD